MPRPRRDARVRLSAVPTTPQRKAFMVYETVITIRPARTRKIRREFVRRDALAKESERRDIHNNECEGGNGRNPWTTVAAPAP